MIPIYAIHREPEIWGQDAEQFRPDRWLQGSLEQQALQTKAFMPFGDGPCNCPGAKFALQEAKLAREAEIAYATLALVTDYDCWHEEHDSVSVEMVVEYLHKNVRNAQLILKDAVVRVANK